ncbi:MAG: exosortase/archaeosortase family protein [Fimbriiglobus sp.]
MPHTFDRPRPLALAGVAAGLLAFGWAFFPTLSFMVGKWTDDPQYSHGFLVPVFAGWLLWRKGADALTGGRPLPVVGGIVLLAALGVRWFAGALLFHQLDALALLVTVTGLALVGGGWKLTRAALPAIAFLVFMVPLPYELERNVGGPLKIAATEASTFFLQMLGYPAIAEGNLILIDEVKLGVVDACSGLKMLVTFAAFAAGAVLLLDRTMFEKFMILLGVVPIAVAVNVARVTATGIAYTLTDSKPTHDFLHDLFGWLMMPAGLGLLAFQLWVLGKMLVPPADDDGLVPLTPAPTPGFGFAA